MARISQLRVINFKIPLQPHQKYYITHSMKNLALQSSLRWKMIIITILTTSLIHFSSKVGRTYVLNYGMKGLTDRARFPFTVLLLITVTSFTGAVFSTFYGVIFFINREYGKRQTVHGIILQKYIRIRRNRQLLALSDRWLRHPYFCTLFHNGWEPIRIEDR